MGKITLPKCPYCKGEYDEKLGSMKYDLMDLATKGYKTNAEVKCDNCGQYFNVTVHITYYGSKIK